MNAYICSVCGFLYDIESAEKDIENNPIPFEELDRDWICPICGANQDIFVQTVSNRPPDTIKSK